MIKKLLLTAFLICCIGCNYPPSKKHRGMNVLFLATPYNERTHNEGYILRKSNDYEICIKHERHIWTECSGESKEDNDRKRKIWEQNN